MITKVNAYGKTMAHLYGGATMWIQVCTTPLLPDTNSSTFLFTVNQYKIIKPQRSFIPELYKQTKKVSMIFACDTHTRFEAILQVLAQGRADEIWKVLSNGVWGLAVGHSLSTPTSSTHGSADTANPDTSTPFNNTRSPLTRPHKSRAGRARQRVGHGARAAYVPTGRSQPASQLSPPYQHYSTSLTAPPYQYNNTTIPALQHHYTSFTTSRYQHLYTIIPAPLLKHHHTTITSPQLQYLHHNHYSIP